MSVVVKSLLAAAAIVFAMQFEVSGQKLETRAERWLASSETSQQLRQVAMGAIKISKDLWKKGANWNMPETEDASSSKKEWKVEFRHKEARQSY